MKSILNFLSIAGILALLSLPAPAFAAISGGGGDASDAGGGGGSEAGNGGSAIVCRDAAGAVTSVELLDFFEGRQIFGQPLDLGPQSLAPYEKVALFLTRLQNMGVSGITLDELEHLVTYFKTEAKFYAGARLVEIPDSDATVIPAGCKQEQMAIQRKPASESNQKEPYFSVNRDLWEHPSFDSDQKAGLILHEILYYASLNYNFRSDTEVRNSRKVRRFLSLFSSGDFFPPLSRLADELSTIGYGAIRFREYQCKLEEIDFHDAEQVRYCTLAREAEIPFQGRLRSVVALGFDRAGVINEFRLDVPTLLQAGPNRLWFAPYAPIRLWSPDRIEGGVVYFDANTRFAESLAQFDGAARIQLAFAGKPHDRIEMRFTPEGELTHCASCRGELIVDGQFIPIGPDLTGERTHPYSSYYVSGPTNPFGWMLFLGEEAYFPIAGKPAYWAASTRLQLLKNRRVRLGTLSRPFELEIGGKSFRAIGDIVFHEGGGVDEATLAENVVLPSCEEGDLPFLAGMTVNFSDSGSCVKIVKAASVSGGLE